MAKRKHKVQGLGDDALGEIILDGKKLDARIDLSTTQASLERTITGLSTLTLTVDDPGRLLLKGGYYSRKADLLLDDLWFRAQQTSLDGDLATITFVDREGKILMDAMGTSHRSRAHSTLAEFLRSRVNAAAPHMPFVCPDLHDKQDIAPLASSDRKAIKDARRGRGISADAKLTIKGAVADAGQIANIENALDVAETKGSGKAAALAMLCAGIGESGWRDIMQGNQVPVAQWLKNPAGPWALTNGYGGCLQGQVAKLDHNWFGKMDRATRTIQQATSFLEGGRGYQGGGAIHLARQGKSAGEIAATVEGSGVDGNSFYGTYLPEAERIYAAYGGVGSNPDTSGGESRAHVKQFVYSQGPPSGPKHESVWECGQRYANLVQRRWFIVAGVLYYIDDWDLIRSRPRMTITDSTPGVDSVNFEMTDSLKKPDSLTIQCRAGRWAAPPGTVIVLGPDYGEAAGAWIVSDILRGDLTDAATTITATKPLEEKPEPASTVVTSTVTPKVGQTSDGGTNAGDLKGTGTMREMCARIDAQQRVYPHPDVHHGNFTSFSLTTPLDCSESTCYALWLAGLYKGTSAIVSGDFGRITEPGPGANFTIYYNASHVFVKFPDGVEFNTAGHAESGPRLGRFNYQTSGFNVGHIKGPTGPQGLPG